MPPALAFLGGVEICRARCTSRHVHSALAWVFERDDGEEAGCSSVEGRPHKQVSFDFTVNDSRSVSDEDISPAPSLGDPEDLARMGYPFSFS